MTCNALLLDLVMGATLFMVLSVQRGAVLDVVRTNYSNKVDVQSDVQYF